MEMPDAFSLATLVLVEHPELSSRLRMACPAGLYTEGTTVSMLLTILMIEFNNSVIV